MKRTQLPWTPLAEQLNKANPPMQQTRLLRLPQALPSARGAPRAVNEAQRLIAGTLDLDWGARLKRLERLRHNGDRPDQLEASQIKEKPPQAWALRP